MSSFIEMFDYAKECDICENKRWKILSIIEN